MEYAETHTYTFKLLRVNPEFYIENIVLHYNVDTENYDEYLLQYDVTGDEYQDLLNGSSLNEDTHVSISELDNGTLSSLFSRSSCFNSCQTISVPCSGEVGHAFGDITCPLINDPDRAAYQYQSCGIVCIDTNPTDEENEESDGSNGGGGGETTNDDVVTNPLPVPCLDRNAETDIDGNCFDENKLIVENCLGSLTGLSLLNDFQLSSIADFIETNGCNGNSEMIIEFLEILDEIPTAKIERYDELLELIEDDPWVLIQDCAEKNGLNASNYIELYDQTIPQECSDRLFNLGVEWHHQPITDGNVPLANIDYYGVEITSYPDFNDDGNTDSEAEIYQAFRDKFIDFGSGNLQSFQFSCDINFDGTVDANDNGDINWEFIPLTAQDGINFTSNDPIASILLIEADASGLGTLAADDGAVIVSDFTANDWTISTIMTANNGTQPFSGNRQWGWHINQNGNFEFFTRAVDVANISTLLNFLPGGANTECQQDTYYNIAEATWENMQQEIVDWINSPESNGGQASIVPKTAVRVDKEKIEELLTSNETIGEINCD